MRVKASNDAPELISYRQLRQAVGFIGGIALGLTLGELEGKQFFRNGLRAAFDE